MEMSKIVPSDKSKANDEKLKETQTTAGKNDEMLFILGELNSTKEKKSDKNDDNNLKDNEYFSFRRATKILLDDVQNEYLRACFKIFNTEYVTVKIFLIVFILLSTSLASFLIIETILSFLNFEVNTTTRVIHETSSEFPKITICNYNPFTTNASIEFLKQINLKTRPDIDVFNDSHLNKLNFAEKTKAFSDVYNAASIAMFNLSEQEKRKLGHKIDDILLHCKFNDETCNASDFTWKFDKFFGNCFVFNDVVKTKKETKRSYIAGSLFGFTVEFYVDFNDNLKLFNSNNMKGAYVRIENSSYYSDDLLDNGIYISPGKWTTALINRAVSYMLPKPYSVCDLDNDSGIKNMDLPLLKLFYHSPFQYTQQSCIIQCLQLKSIEMCNCTYPLYLSLFEAENCNDEAELICYYSVWGKFLERNYVQDACIPLCPLECNRTSFAYSLTEVDILGDILVDYINENKNLRSDYITRKISADTMRKGVVRLTIFSDSLSYTESTESPKMDLVSLFANIGGHLGLFLNVGFFSLCEIFTMAFEFFFVIKEKRSHTNKISKN